MKTESRYRKKLITESCFHLHKILDSVKRRKPLAATVKAARTQRSGGLLFLVLRYSPFTYFITLSVAVLPLVKVILRMLMPLAGSFSFTPPSV